MQGDIIEVTTERGNVFRVTEDNEAECRSCGAPVLWCITAKGKSMPVDVPTEGPTTSHFDTCPQKGERRQP